MTEPALTAALPPRRVWVTGAAGLIGNYLRQTAPTCVPGWDILGLTRARLDLTDSAAVERAWVADAPELLVHCAALSRSPDCEHDPARARLVNVEVTRRLVELAADSAFVFLSSDLVFDGRAGNYAEDAIPNPLSVYAATKLEAEQCVRRHPRHLIVRTSLTAGISLTADRSFNEDLRRAWSAGRSVRLFTDEYRSPMHASVTARAVWELARGGARGLLHVAGTERLSRYAIGHRVAACCPQLRPQIEAASLRDYRGAPRAPDTTLNTAAAQARLSFPLPGFSAWLAAHPEAV